MTSYIEYKINDLVLKGLQKESGRWSRVQRPILALSVYSSDSGGTVKLLDEDGLQVIETNEKEADLIPIKPGLKISCFQWHPNSLVLAISWDSGQMGIYSLKSSRTKWTESNSKTYSKQKSVVIIEWINEGQGLITVDMTGKVTFWHFDEMSNILMEKSNHQITDQITDIVSVNSNKSSLVYLGSTSGIVYQMIGTTGKINDIVALESGVKRILYYSKRNRLIIITESMLLCQYSVSSSSSDVCEVAKVKLSSSGRNMSTDIINAMMIDDSVGLIAICFTGERVVRLWQLESGHNAAVIVAESADSHWAGVTSVDYCNGILVAGTSNNHVIVWKRSSGLDFNRVSQIQVKGSVKQVCVGQSRHITCITSTNDIYMINEQSVCFSYCNKTIVIQNGAKQIKVKNIDSDETQELRVEVPIRSIFVGTNGKVIAIKLSGSKQVDFYRTNGSADVIDSLCSASISETDNKIMIDDNIVWSCFINNDEQNANFSLISYNLQTNSEEKHQIDLLVNADNKDVMQIKVIAFDISGDSLMTVLFISNKYFLYIFKLNGQKQTIKSGPTRISSHTRISFAKINRDGSMVACIDDKLLSILYNDQIISFNIDNSSDGEVTGLCWADNESRLLCFTQETKAQILLCSHKENLIKLYDQIEIQDDMKLVAFNVPTIYFLKGEEIVKKKLSELDGLSEETTSIMLDFLTAKSVDLNQIIKQVNQIGENNNKLWMNLAKLSVKSRDVNMGIYCVSKLQNARVVRDVKQELAESGDSNIACAVLAMNLGLHSEAEEILKSSKNQLKLSKYYQDRNEWDKAIKSVDRVNQKTVYYNYAKHLEHDESNVTEAIKYYEMSGTHVFEVPRMLFDIDGNSMLQDYCLSDNSNSSEKDSAYLIRWWGQYCESQGDINHALNAYEKAKDYYNLVRLLCYTGEVERAKTLINSLTNDTADEAISTKDAAMLHLGRHLESVNPIESINYYLPCGAIKHAIRVCKTNHFINELIKLIITYGTIEEAKQIVANYIENNRFDHEISDESLVQLYYKCGFIEKAIESALRKRTWSQLRDLLRDEISKAESEQVIGITINESTTQLALEALKTESDIVDIVIDLLLLLKNDQTSLMEQLVRDYNIEVNEKLIEKVERITKNQQQKEHLMLALADMALQQGNCLVAAKLYNNQGLRTNAIKALIRTGQTDKVISYANIARDKNVYKIAANYLQTMNYGDDSVITNFYKKAGAKQELNRFNKRENE